LGGDSFGHWERKVHINMSLILNGYRDKAISVSMPNLIRFLCVGLDEKQSLQKKGGYIRPIAGLHFYTLLPT
jgi:hypothetical protein